MNTSIQGSLNRIAVLPTAGFIRGSAKQAHLCPTFLREAL